METHKRYAVAIVILAVAVDLVACQTAFGGWVTESFTLDVSRSPYVVSSSIIIDNNVTLTIDRGVELRFEPGVGVVVNGSLVANGSETQRITFTATQPISSQDTPYSWNGISWEEDAGSLTEIVDFLSTTRSTSILSYVDVSAAGAIFEDSSGDGTLQYRGVGPALFAIGIAPPLDNVRVINNFGPGVEWQDISMTAEIHDCKISNNTGNGLSFTSDGFGRLEMDGCVVDDNIGSGIVTTSTRLGNTLDIPRFSFCTASISTDEHVYLDHTNLDTGSSDGCVQVRICFSQQSGLMSYLTTVLNQPIYGIACLCKVTT